MTNDVRKIDNTNYMDYLHVKPVDGAEMHYQNQIWIYDGTIERWILQTELEPDEYLEFMALLNEEHYHE